ncbi:MAG: 5'/3'-nucleotidase SurE [Deltaproteobacteria bacterium]|nr:5'/3'-nucleotidase SurE [Deltaproteobacteria bacterium]
MRVLVSNDDGIDAPGIELLRACAAEVFEEVFVVAPAAEMSGVGQCLTLHAPLRVQRRDDFTFAVTGTPVDCILVALGHVLPDHRPDLVLSGVNRGPNLGNDVHYSGTVAAAREGAIQGIPSVAFSLAGHHAFPFTRIAPALTALLRWLRDARPGGLLNVNIPLPAADATAPGLAGVPGLRGVRVTRLGQRSYANRIIYRDDPRGVPYFWIGGDFPEMQDVDGTDCNAVRDGYVSVTPLGLDSTAFDSIAALGALERLSLSTPPE